MLDANASPSVGRPRTRNSRRLLVTARTVRGASRSVEVLNTELRVAGGDPRPGAHPLPGAGQSQREPVLAARGDDLQSERHTGIVSPERDADSRMAGEVEVGGVDGCPVVVDAAGTRRDRTLRRP